MAAVDPKPRTYRGQAHDQRRALRRERLLEAGLDLLGTDGWRATTVTAVCERARLTPRYFYESFRDRDQLLVAVFDAVMEDVARRVVAATPGDLHDMLRATITAFVDVVTDDPRKGRVAFLEALGSEALMQRRLETMRWFAQQVATQASVQSGIDAQHDHAIEAAGLLAAGGLIEMMIAWLGGHLKTGPQQLIEAYTKLCTASFDAAMTVPRAANGRRPRPRSSRRS